MLLVLTLLACTGKEDDSGAAVAAPTVTWLSPTDGATVTAGLVSCSIVIDGFALQDPAKHNDGAPAGYIAISVDDAVVLSTGDTTFDLTVGTGPHTLTAQLYYADGDEVSATTTRLCDEEDTDTACAPVVASIAINAGAEGAD